MITDLKLSPQIKGLWDKCFILNQNIGPFLKYEWHEAYLTTVGKKLIPLILYDRQADIIAPFTVKDGIATLSGGPEISDYCDIVGPDNKKEAVWKDIIKYLQNKRITVIILNNIPVNSTTYDFFQRRQKQDEKITFKQEDTTPILELPSSMDTLLNNLSRKHRHELNRKVRKFKREYPEYRTYISKDPQKDIDILIGLMKSDPEKNNFLSSGYEDFFRKIPVYLKDLLLLQILEINRQPASAILSFKSSDELQLYNSGFDETRFSGSGFFLKTENIIWAIENGFKKYNFLQGSERYKYELGGKDFFVYNIEVKI